MKEEQKIMEEKIRGLEEKSRLKDEIIAQMNHELRTPFAGIMGYSSLLAQGNVKDPEKVKKAGRVIYRNANELLKMIDNMMIYVKSNLGKIYYNNDAFLVGEFLDSIVDVYIPLFMEKEIEFIVDNHCSECRVYGDSSKVRQILTNLLSNAFKFSSRNGNIILCVIPYEEGMIRVSVTDTGIGIAPEEQEKIFERYYQSQEALEMGQRGLGLGLSIVREFVQMMGGQIWVDSERGEGSTFSFTLPLYQGQEDA